MTRSDPLTFPETAAASVAAVPAVRVRRSLLKNYLVLGKARLSAMVVVTTALGFIVGSKQVPEFDFGCLLWTCLGTFLAAIGAAAFNQALEARRDGRMLRTKNRPIPTGDISATHACFFGLITTIIGVAILCPTSHGLTAVLAVITTVLYVAVYTPMKTRSTANTLVGAVVGGIPPMIGWCAATGSLSAGAWILGTILFIWQIPHFLALAWMYREDYTRGGYKMVSTVEPTGRLTALLSVLYSLALIPACLAMTFLGHAGVIFAITSVVLGAGLAILAVRFAKSRTNVAARKLFLATLLYLPLISLVMVIDAKGPFDGMEPAPAGYIRPSNEIFIDPDRGPLLAPPPARPEQAR